MPSIEIDFDAELAGNTKIALHNELCAALERAQNCICLLNAGRPVQDVIETLAEIDHVLARAKA